MNVRGWIFKACLLTTILCFGFPAQAKDANHFVIASHVLIEDAAPGKFRDFFEGTTPRLIQGNNVPLARYSPIASEGVMGIVEIGNDMGRYRREYTIATVIIPKPQRPGFDQYMTVLTALNLANEKAHFDQHKNKSLADFFAYRERGDIARACALYALQQHVSDVTMLDMALKLLTHFRKLNSDYGMNAVTASLDRMGLLQIYWAFQEAAIAKDRVAMTGALHQLKTSRDRINLSGMKPCRTSSGTVSLPNAVISRAISPAYPYLLTYSTTPPAPASKGYNE